jgi:hypothetical protein
MIKGKTRKKATSTSSVTNVKHYVNFDKLSTALFTSFLLMMLTSCSTQKSPLEAFKKLTGAWIEANDDSKFIETWTWKNDTLLIGSSLMTVGKDTAFSEKIQLVAQNDSIYYIPAVSDQNNGETIRFGLISSNENEWVFENKKHDFPTQIIYTLKEKDSLIVVVKGSENGRKQAYTFRMQKVK